MKKPSKVTPLDQHIIDKIRIRRLEKNLSGRELSRRVTLSENPTRIGGIESPLKNNKYTSSILKKVVAELDWTLHDVLPDELLSDDTLQDKTKIPILKGMSVRAALNSLLEEGYFDEPRLRREITEYYNSFFKPEEYKNDNYFSAQLEDLYNEGKLTKLDPDKSKDEKLIRFQRNPTYDPNA